MTWKGQIYVIAIKYEVSFLINAIKEPLMTLLHHPSSMRFLSASMHVYSCIEPMSQLLWNFYRARQKFTNFSLSSIWKMCLSSTKGKFLPDADPRATMHKVVDGFLLALASVHPCSRWPLTNLRIDSSHIYLSANNILSLVIALLLTTNCL